MNPNDKKKRSRQGVSRRRFLQGSAIGAVAVSGANLIETKAAARESYYPATTPGGEYDFTKQSAALQPDAIVDSACQFCNSLCRLKVYVKDGRIIDVLGEPDDPVQAGAFASRGQ